MSTPRPHHRPEERKGAGGGDPVAALDDEWRFLARSALLRERIRRWAKQEPALRPFADGRSVVRFLRGPGLFAEKDALLGALLRLGRDDGLAARVALEALLPGLKRLAARMVLDSRDRDDLWQFLLATMWGQLRGGYPLARRPSRIAANLLLETRRQALKALEQERRPLVGEEPRCSAWPSATDGDIDALLGRAVSAGAVTVAEAELILSTRIDGVPLAAVAASTGARENTLYVRRLRAERRLLLFLGRPAVKKTRSKAHCFSARACGVGSRAAPAEEPSTQS